MQKERRVQTIVSAWVLVGLMFGCVWGAEAPEKEETTAEPAAAPETPAAKQEQRPTAPAAPAQEQPKPDEEKETVVELTKNHRGLLMNFRNASVKEVLKCIAEANGLSVVQEKEIDGDITVVSAKSVSFEDALNILNAALTLKGATSILSGKVLKVISLADAKTRNVPIYTGADPEEVKEGDHVITQVIPISQADAEQIKEDLASLIPEHAGLTANLDSNSLIYTDTATNVKRLLKLLKSVEGLIASVSEIKIYTLENADAGDLKEALDELFQTQLTQRTRFMRSMSSMRSRYMSYRMMRSGGSPSSSSGSRSRGSRESAASSARQEVRITTDERTNSLIVVASKDNLALIDQLVEKLDTDPAEVQGTLVYHCKNADAERLAEVINDLFSEQSGRSGTRRYSGSRSSRTPTTRTPSRSSGSSRSSYFGRGSSGR